MGAATFGELLGAASGHLQAPAQVPDTGLELVPVAAAIRQARRLVGALSRYLDDVIADGQVEVIMARDAGSQAHAAVQAREALAMAGSSLRAAGDSVGPDMLWADPLATGLAKAVTCLRAGRDLLRTHVVTDPDGIRSPASRWTAVLTTPEFTAALLDQIARQSRLVAVWAAALSYATAGQAGIPVQVRGSLASVPHWLQLAAAAADASQRLSPVTPAGRLLLHAIPVNAVPDPQPLAGAEPTAVLCEGIAASAMRLRAAVRWPAEQAAWSPALTAESWRWTATATAVAADTSVALLRSLAERTGQAGGPPATARQLLADAAAVAEEACGSWRLVAAAWKEMTTETRGLTAPGVPDTGDLILRLGRLAFADPLWAPARSRSAPVRDPADLAAGAGEARAVLAAVHDAADALAVTSAVDLRAVALAVRAGRLHAPARSLPERDDKVVRRFGSALAADTTALRGAYASAAADSAALADALDTAAVALDAPTKVLAVARAAVRASRDGAGTGVGQAESLGRVLPAGDEGVLSARISAEDQVRGLGVGDPMLLLRARAIGRAWQQVVAQAQAVAGQPGTPGEVEAYRQRGPAQGTALGVAAQSFLRGASAALARRQGTRPGAQRRGTTAGSGPRALPPQASAR